MAKVRERIAGKRWLLPLVVLCLVTVVIGIPTSLVLVLIEHPTGLPLLAGVGILSWLMFIAYFWQDMPITRRHDPGSKD